MFICLFVCLFLRKISWRIHIGRELEGGENSECSGKFLTERIILEHGDEEGQGTD